MPGYLCRPEKWLGLRIILGSWIGSSAVENHDDEGVLDFQGPDERRDIGIGYLKYWIGSSVG